MKKAIQKKAKKTLRQMSPQERLQEVKIALMMKVHHVKRATAEAMIRAKAQEKQEKVVEMEDEIPKVPRRPRLTPQQKRLGHAKNYISAEEFFGA